MKRLFLPSFILLLTTLVLAVIPTDKEGEIYSDTIRLHILAESNSEEDQSIKLSIRDKLLNKYGEELSSIQSKEDAEEKISKTLRAIEDDVNLWLSELGSTTSANVTLNEEWYDTREYESFTLPRGYYKSLKIIIGKGEGKNWWCVLYPPLCLDIATEESYSDDALIGYSKEEKDLISNGEYNIKFKLLEFISDIFS